MPELSDITVLIINYRTLDFTTRCVESFVTHYPYVKLLVIDNGSYDESRDYVTALADRSPYISCLLNEFNRYHGPALDQGMRDISTPLVLTLDSDTVVRKTGFLEPMCALFSSPQLYAVGKLVSMDWFGYEAPDLTFGRFSYIHPCCSLLNREIYIKLKRFTHHGSPGISNMRHARRAGYGLQDFPIEDYIEHLGRGTCSRYGYGLGPRHTLEYLVRQALINLAGLVNADR